jgi:hypothetical protein
MSGERRVASCERDYPRLKALVMANQSALSLDLVELLRLAEDPMCPIEAASAYKWATQFAIPVIAELRRRLENSAQQVEYKPQLIKLVREMRKAQRGKDRELREALEARVDDLVRDEVQPSLFGASTVGEGA